MPQLMPLEWIFSSMMMVIVMVSATVIYGEVKSEAEVSSVNKESSKSMWFW